MPFDRERYLSNQLTPSLGHGGVLRDVTVASVCILDAYQACHCIHCIHCILVTPPGPNYIASM